MIVLTKLIASIFSWSSLSRLRLLGYDDDKTQRGIYVNKIFSQTFKIEFNFQLRNGMM